MPEDIELTDEQIQLLRAAGWKHSDGAFWKKGNVVSHVTLALRLAGEASAKTFRVTKK